MIRIVVGIVRILAFLFIARLVLRAVAGALRPGEPNPKSGTARPDGAVTLLRDRICNTFFPAPRGVRVTIAGEEQVFCSTECAQRARVLASS